jgi:galactokinase
MMAVPTEIAQRISAAGLRAFGRDWGPDRLVAAPGRIEVIGNHLDYNGGPVLAAAIDRHVVIGVHEHSGRAGIQALFADFGNEPIEITPEALGDWRISSGPPVPADFLRGAIASMQARAIPVRTGIRLVVTGNLPHGVGISSSAAFCVATVLALAAEPPPAHEIVLIAQEAEHRAGSPCGTMDQSASVFGGLIRYDGSDDSVRTVPADLTGHQFVVVNSGVVRSLAGSAYSERVRESQAALTVLKHHWRDDLLALGAIPTESLDEALDVLESRGEGTLSRRVRHVVTESQRVRDTEHAITLSDWAEVGRLMTASGRSSATDYDISHPRVERVVALCQQTPGVLGARMMGGGQGGSALVLARSEAIESLTDRLDREYYADLPAAPAVRLIPCTFAPGADSVNSPQLE